MIMPIYIGLQNEKGNVLPENNSGRSRNSESVKKGKGAPAEARGQPLRLLQAILDGRDEP